MTFIKAPSASRNLLASCPTRQFSSEAVYSDNSGEEYVRSRYQNVAEDADLSIFDSVNQAEIEEYIKTTLMEKYGYSEEDIDYLVHFHPKVCLPPPYEQGGCVETISEYLIDKFGVTTSEMKEIILRYPIYLRTEVSNIESRLKLYKDIGIIDKEITDEDIGEIFKEAPFYLI